MLERWNDDRMDALDAKVSDLSSLMREQRQEMREQRQEMREQRGEFSTLQRTMVMATVGILGTFITGFGILVGLIVAM